MLFGAAGGVILALLGLMVFGLSGDLEVIAALTCFQNTLPTPLYSYFFSPFLMAAGGGGLGAEWALGLVRCRSWAWPPPSGCGWG